MKTFLSFVVLLASFAVALPAQEAGKADKKQEVTPTRKAWNELQGAYRKAVTEFMAPVNKAKSREEAARNRESLDMSKHPAHEYLPKIQAFAAANKGTPEGLEALSAVVNLAMTPAGGDKAPNAAAAKTAFETILSDYIDDAALARFASGVIRVASQAGLDGRAAAERIIKKSPHKEVRANAMVAVAEKLSDDAASDEDKKEAAALFETLEKDYADTASGKRAKAMRFAAENLAVGKACPDEEAVDENGAKFKISDYKGKVVVLDFWGIW